jgi:hypothetical protein
MIIALFSVSFDNRMKKKPIRQKSKMFTQIEKLVVRDASIIVGEALLLVQQHENRKLLSDVGDRQGKNPHLLPM